MPSNQKIPWHNEYNIGVKEIDKQHKKLFDLVNTLYELNDKSNIREDLRKILYDFSYYTKTHFQDEEEYMLSIDFPLYKEHKQIHQNILKALSKILSTPAKPNIIKSKMKIAAKRLIIDHIVHEDMKIKLFLLEKEEKISEEIFIINDFE